MRKRIAALALLVALAIPAVASAAYFKEVGGCLCACQKVGAQTWCICACSDG